MWTNFNQVFDSTCPHSERQTRGLAGEALHGVCKSDK
jgi:hypothetical protein